MERVRQGGEAAGRDGGGGGGRISMCISAYVRQRRDEGALPIPHPSRADVRARHRHHRRRERAGTEGRE